MFDFFFFVKSILVAILLVALLQIKVGDSTLETRTTNFIQASGVIMPLQSVADGGVKAFRDSVNWVAREINTRWRGTWPWSKERKVEEQKSTN